MSNDLRFWTDAAPSWMGPLIRIEWSNAQGVTESTFGRFFDSDNEINWQYADCPSHLEELALEAARYGSEYPVHGAEHMGSETFAQMDAQCANRCCGCGVVQASIEDLSEQGHCSKCFVARMAADDLVVYPADYVSPEAKAEMARTHAECLAPGGSF